jgi:RHS repeat-associated protein
MTWPYVFIVRPICEWPRTVFGSVRSQSGQQSIFGFTGQQTDPTDLSYLHARYYDPTLGRFLSPDSFQPNAPGTQGFNQYSYAAADPTTATDPSGKELVWNGFLSRALAVVESIALRTIAFVLANKLKLLILALAIGAAVAAPQIVRQGEWIIIRPKQQTPTPAPSPNVNPCGIPFVCVGPGASPAPPTPSPTPKRCTIDSGEVPGILQKLEFEAEVTHASTTSDIVYEHQTVAALEARRSDGSCVDVIGGSGSGLDREQRLSVQQLGAQVATGSSGAHAEVTVLKWLDNRSWTPLVLAISAVGTWQNGTICDENSGYTDSCSTEITKFRVSSVGTITDDQRGAVWWGNLS